MINKERIEYLVKDGNVLKQLRRGTLGTGVANIHPKGEQVFLADISKYVPYVDTTQSQTATNVDTVDLNFLPLTSDEFEVFVNGIRLNSKSIDKFDPTLGLDSPEADVIVPALQIYINIMRWAEITEIYVPKIGLADGLIQSLYEEVK